MFLRQPHDPALATICAGELWCSTDLAMASLRAFLQGATIINGARGKHMVEADILAALDSGQVR